MYSPNDTITAVSSPGSDHRVIIRLSGARAIDILNQIFTPAVSGNPGIAQGKIMNLDSIAYVFREPHSYTGDDLAEVHLWANPAVTEVIIERLLALGARPAGPGEFTARAYLNGKIDLAQAEAVNEVVTASNTFQLAAAENLLAGHFGRTTQDISSAILDCLSQIEARLDFSAEDIAPTTQADLVTAIRDTSGRLQNLLSSSVQCESILDLPAVGIAGAPNAGKSTLMNKLLGKPRSIVSHQRKTTRDVLTGETTLGDCRCVLFDCAGLTAQPETILDELAQEAAIAALREALAVIFCVDIAKRDWAEDLTVCRLINPTQLIPIATKVDLLSEEVSSVRTSKLKPIFGAEFIPISAHTDTGMARLRAAITKRIVTATSGHSKYVLALTVRHRQSLASAVENLDQAVAELEAGNDEVAAMLLRTAHGRLTHIEQHQLDEQLLDRIFSRFCIGK